ncbi:MAG: hypothetical protein AB9846_05340 [Tenuifilaceae bacterium]
MASVKGEVVDLGDGMTDHGVYYSTTANAKNGVKVSAGVPSGTGEFTVTISGLTLGTKYYACTYGSKNSTFVYGDEVNFTTLGIATITTTAIASITATTASSGGSIASDGGAAVTARGVCWSTSTSPTTALTTKTTDGSGTGSFTSSITGLTANMSYYVRAYATNSVETSYGNEVSFKTLDGVASLTTAAATSVTATTASSGGSITSDGGATVTARGICWSTSPNPTIALATKTTDGSGTGSFISSITGLIANTTYYIRAYAKNSVGTYYGNEVNFTSAITSIGATYAGGIVFYIDSTGQHGLVCATSDQNSGAQWGCYESSISGADGTEIGTGKQNTIDIVNGCSTSGIAARLCYDLVLNGYSDWFLPSKDEQHEMYINLRNAGIGNFAEGTYWSSSEEIYWSSGSYYAWGQYFNSSNQVYYVSSYYNKDNKQNVRAVRAF